MHLSAEISTVWIEKNPCSDVRLNVEKSAEVTVPHTGGSSSRKFLETKLPVKTVETYQDPV